MATADPGHVQVRTSERPRRDLRDGAVAMAPLAAGYAPFALAIGMAAGASRDPFAAWAGSLLIFGGSAQLLVIDLVDSGAGLWAAVAAAVVIQARLLVFSATLAPLWRGASVPQRLAAAAVVIDPLWALASRRATRSGSAPSQRLYYAGAAAVLACAWPAAMAAGVLVGGSASGTPPGTASAGFGSLLGMCVPACLAAVVGTTLRTSAGTRAVLAAVLVGWFTRSWPDGAGLLVAMVAAGLAGTGPRSPRTPS
jgi:predicted branched-subunit amino acid permease